MARPKHLAEFVEPCLGRTLAAQGFSGSDILLSWADIVGERLGTISQPLKVAWPRRGPPGDGTPPEPATLQIRVEGAFALEVQHLAPVIIERVNAHYGWRCIGRLVLKQGPVRRPAPPPPRRLPSPAEERQVADAVAPVSENGLRAALARLGTAILTDKPAAETDGTASADAFLPRSS